MMCVRTYMYMYVFVTLRNVTFRNVMAKTTRQLSNESVNHTRNVTLSNVTHCADSVDRSTIDVAHGDIEEEGTRTTLSYGAGNRGWESGPGEHVSKVQVWDFQP